MLYESPSPPTCHARHAYLQYSISRGHVKPPPQDTRQRIVASDKVWLPSQSIPPLTLKIAFEYLFSSRVSSTMLTTHTHFLKRLSLYDEEKPYSLRYTPPLGFPRANIEVERHEIRIEDIRPRLASLTLAQDGCEILRIVSRMRYEDFDNEETTKSIYLREVADTLCRRLGAQRVQVFEHTVRRRHVEFPISTGEAYQWNQPTSIAHVDTTLPWTLDMARKLNPGNEAIFQHRIQCVK